MVFDVRLQTITIVLLRLTEVLIDSFMHAITMYLVHLDGIPRRITADALSVVVGRVIAGRYSRCKTIGPN